ncbi:hypothetical protein DBV05_g10488 [Lasiodiplodia theobromae]|uniref:Uncharacterized protein n=1 Tax=Lasiodiplodia theobromae TaxID=45133 RepID=A0A5N5CZQ1_9PEZI|nr:hypothetical protein DBV05_g10488 [Lasiodiplodia theobromae]
MDPGTVVGVVAFPLGAIAFLAETISSLARRGEAVKECEDRIQDYYRQLRKCESNLGHWVELWCPQSHFPERQQFCEDSYRYMWGEETFEQVQQYLKRIKKLTLELGKLIMNGTDWDDSQRESAAKEMSKRELIKQKLRWRGGDPTREDWEKWKDCYKVRTDSSVHKSQSSLSRIAFALYRSESLEDKLRRLEAATSGLEEISAEGLRKMKIRMRGRDLHPRDIDKALKLNSYYSSLKKFSKEIHDAQQRVDHDGRWALMLRSPDPNGDAEDWDSLSVLDIDFTLQLMSPKDQPTWKRFRVQHKKGTKPENTATSLLDHIAQPNSVCSSTSELRTASRKQLSIPFQKIFDQGHLQNERARIASRKEIACLAWKYVNWVILLWDTPWMRDPCSCSLRFERNGNAEHRHVLSLDPTKECRNQYLAGNHKLVLLGLVLAELVTLRPIRIKADSSLIATDQRKEMSPLESVNAVFSSGLPRFALEHREWDHSKLVWKQWIPLPIESLLTDIRRTSGEGYRDAVDYCLDGNLSRGLGPFSPNFVEEFVENILIP